MEERRKQLADMAFDAAVQKAVSKAHGRSAAAILGVLGAERVETLKGSKNQAQDIAEALEALKKENGYLFDDGRVPPPYAPGTGGINHKPGAEPASLAEALRAKYNMN